jgi:hypothetical protein
MALFRRKPKQDDTEAMRALAASLGLTFAGQADDEYRRVMGDLPELPLLREGNDTSVHRLMYGVLDQVETRMFDFVPVVDVEYPGDERRSCVLFTFPRTNFPEVFISPRDRLQRLGEQLREGGVAIGTPELMRKYRIQAHVARHATDLLGTTAQDLLLHCTITGLRIEIEGPAILGHVPDLPGADEFRVLYQFMHAFRESIPAQTWDHYRRL